MVIHSLNGFNLSCDLAKSRGITLSIGVLQGWSPSAKFNGHEYCGIGDIKVLVCHVILQDELIKGSCDFMGWSLSIYVTILPRLVAIDTGVV